MVKKNASYFLSKYKNNIQNKISHKFLLKTIIGKYSLFIPLFRISATFNFFLYWNLVGVCVWGRAKTDFKNLTFTHSIYICLKQSVYFTSSFFCLIKSSTFDPTLQKVSLCQNYVHTKTTIQTMNTSMTINSVFPNRD